MDFWIPLLGGALGAALINGVLALYKLRHDVDLEHSQWSRNKRQDVYLGYMSAVADTSAALEEAFIARANGEEDSAAKADAALVVVEAMKAEVFLVAHHGVIGGIVDMTSALYELRAAFREAVDVDGWEAAADKLSKATYRFVSLARVDLGHYSLDKKLNRRIELMDWYTKGGKP